MLNCGDFVELDTVTACMNVVALRGEGIHYIRHSRSCGSVQIDCGTDRAPAGGCLNVQLIDWQAKRGPACHRDRSLPVQVGARAVHGYSCCQEPAQRIAKIRELLDLADG